MSTGPLTVILPAELAASVREAAGKACTCPDACPRHRASLAEAVRGVALVQAEAEGLALESAAESGLSGVDNLSMRCVDAVIAQVAVLGGIQDYRLDHGDLVDRDGNVVRRATVEELENAATVRYLKKLRFRIGVRP